MIASMVFYVGKKERKNKERWKADERILAAYRITWPCVRGLASALQRPPTAPVITELGPAGEHELCAKIYRASVPLSLVREAAAALCCSRGLRSLLQPPNRDIPRAYMYLLLGCELLSRACALQKAGGRERKCKLRPQKPPTFLPMYYLFFLFLYSRFLFSNKLVSVLSQQQHKQE